jgi:hypothetical protein
MKPDADPARRVAWLMGIVLTLFLAAVVYWNDERGPQPKGVGVGLLLEKQEELRRDLAREGRHLNDLETWQIQEEVALRSGLSRAAVKSLVKRARHARDPRVMLDALLLSGEVESAAIQAKRRAESLVKTDAKNASSAFRQAGDGFWRNAQFEEAAECYGKAGPAARMDLALLHWMQANFHPEDPLAELQDAQMASRLVVKELKAEASPLDVAAAHRLLGNALLRLDKLRKTSSQTGELDGAEEAMRIATGAFERGLHPELWASIHHDQGVVMLVKSEGEPRSMEPLEAAVRCFLQALEVRTGSIPDGTGKADTLALRLSQRAETLAYLAVAQAYLSDFQSVSGESAIATADLALGLSQPQDPGLTWFMAQYAKLRALVKQPSFALKNGKAATPEQASARFLELITTFERTLQNYPTTLADHPGVPSLADVIGIASLMCENRTHSLTKEQLREPSERLVRLLKPFAKDGESPASSAALKAMDRCLNLAG